MSYLKKNEQIKVENVEQLKSVYDVLKREWSEYYSINMEIEYFFNKTWYCFVSWHDEVIALYNQDDNLTTISYNQFMARVKPTTEHTIIESVDGKKYKAIVVEEVREPMTYEEWYHKNFKELSHFFNFTISPQERQNKFVEKYVEYRKTFEQ